MRAPRVRETIECVARGCRRPSDIGVRTTERRRITHALDPDIDQNQRWGYGSDLAFHISHCTTERDTALRAESKRRPSTITSRAFLQTPFPCESTSASMSGPSLPLNAAAPSATASAVSSRFAYEFR